MKNKNWEGVYQSEFNGTWYPAENIIKFCARYMKRRIGIDSWHTKKNVNRILDAGCGVGRHVKFFQEQGLNTWGIDISTQAVKIGNKWLKNNGLKPKLKTASVTKLPFKDDFFDVVICHETLDHITPNEAIKEIKRVCKSDGYIYLSFRATSDSEFHRGKKTGNNTFVLEKGYEKGLIQHYFDQKEIANLLNKLKIFDVTLIEEKYPKQYGIDKAFLQSSEEYKKYFDLNKKLDTSMRYARWHVIAENI
jgi:ubiquinone/menaquinone biosynthesis C-methylase UbiE